MRLYSLTLLALPLLALAPRLRVPAYAHVPGEHAQESEEFDAADWDEALTHVFPDGRVRAPEGQGAMGTTGLEVKLGKVDGVLLVDRRHGDQVSIFLGWAPPEKYRTDIADDLRVRFKDTDGVTHVTRLNAGRGTGLQFVSPADVELAKLESFSLLFKSKAKWLKGK